MFQCVIVSFSPFVPWETRNLRTKIKSLVRNFVFKKLTQHKPEIKIETINLNKNSFLFVSSYIFSLHRQPISPTDWNNWKQWIKTRPILSVLLPLILRYWPRCLSEVWMSWLRPSASKSFISEAWHFNVLTNAEAVCEVRVNFSQLGIFFSCQFWI